MSPVEMPPDTKRRTPALRRAWLLWTLGDASTNYKPIKSPQAIARMCGCTDAAVIKARDSDGWESQELAEISQAVHGKIALLPDTSQRLNKLNIRVDETLALLMATPAGSPESDQMSAQLDRLLKMVGHDKQLAIAAKVAERHELNRIAREERKLRELEDAERDGLPVDGGRVATGAVIDVSGD